MLSKLFDPSNWIQMLYMIIPIILALSVHEFSHALASYKLGDTTAADEGRLSLDPIKHIDPIGLLMLFTLGFGWAKPVPFNPYNLKNRKRDTIIISIAGPLANFILAFIFALILRFLPFNNEFLVITCIYGITINVGLGVFNLLPIPPLDGSKILASLLPAKLEIFFYENERYIYFILIILAVTGLLGSIISPILSPVTDFFLGIAGF